jgi:hypothetical protein
MTVAAVEVQTWIGAGPTKATASSPRMHTSDIVTADNTYPIPIPAAGFNYSYWMNLALTITNIQDATVLNNHQVYMDGACGWALGTDGELLVGVRDAGDNGCPDASYEQAAGTQGTTGYSIMDGTNGHDYYKGQDPGVAALDGYNSGSTLEVDTQDLSAAGSFDHLVIQAKVDTAANGAVRGAQAAETITFIYDEI